MRDNKLSNITFAETMGIKEDTLQKYISGDAFPNREDMERIFTFTSGKVRPMDFCFLFRYQKDFEIIDYIKHCIDSNIVCIKEIGYELGVGVSGICKRLQGKYNFNSGEIQKIMKLIESKKSLTM